MKTLHLSITILITAVLLFSMIHLVSQSAFGKDQTYNPTFEEQYGNSTKTKLVHDDSILILNQTIQKLVYKMGENITISTELINIGNKTVSVAYLEPEFFLEIKNQAGDVVWPQHTIIGWVPEYSGIKTLKPGEYFSAQPWGITQRQDIFPHTIRLSVPGNYTVISIGLFTFNTTHSVTAGNLEPVWSKPLQITILPEKVPEFPFAPLVLLISITSLLVFYKMKSKNRF